MRATLLATLLALYAGAALARVPLDLTLLYGPPRAAPATGALRALPQVLNASQTLREAAAAAGVHIGGAINYGGMHELHYGPNYPATVLREFSTITAENECKVGPIHPQATEYAYDQCDYLLGTAVANASFPRMHNYCWHTENPDWLNKLTDPAALRAALASHIGNVTAHYLLSPGGALAYAAVDVVNEAISDGGANAPLLKQAVPWYPALPDYVEVAFKAAAAANVGNSLLCYNEYGAEGWSSAKAKRVVTLVKSLQAAGAPVNCVGLQMHISVDQAPTAADIQENIRQLGLLGLTVHITEMDVKCPGCSATGLQAQAQVYSDVLGACLAQPNCKSFETWGVFDGDTWVGSNNRPLLWDEQWQPKPAYNAVLATLQHHAAARRA